MCVLLMVIMKLTLHRYKRILLILDMEDSDKVSDEPGLNCGTYWKVENIVVTTHKVLSSTFISFFFF